MWRDTPPIVIFSPSHLAVLGGALGTSVLLLLLSRRASPWAQSGERTLAILLLLAFPLRFGVAASMGALDADNILPLQYCDVAALVAGFALLLRRQMLVEIAYFWGMSGTLNGLLTPNLQHDFPHPEFFVFFLLHAGVVIAAFHLTISWRCWPRWKGVWLAWGWSAVYLTVVATVNLLMGSNYAFICRRPDNPSLFDKMPAPPSPAQILVLAGLSLTFYLVLYLPFGIARWRNRLAPSCFTGRSIEAGRTAAIRVETA
ncbi:MAG: TIGR02206 family membrane protein [Verrucomicrobiales bacterium]|nr:TIGR02206 family membrane protein [Verrucomicrobiales bacterium]